MADPQPFDLTRWNRAGLARVQYVDGNAAVFLERMRSTLAAQFPHWPALTAITPNGSTAADHRQYLESLYAAANEDDVLWALTRSSARAAHILAATLDAYANEGWIGTATQWESLRRLVAMLDYAPHPPGSAYTTLALLLKEGISGQVDAGLQLRYAPADGSPPLLFETLEACDADAARNLMRAVDHDRNPNVFSGSVITLQGTLDQLSNADPIVFEDDRSGALSAHMINGVSLAAAAEGAEQTRVTFVPPLSGSAGFVLGHTIAHGAPKDKLALKGPLTTGAEVGTALQLTGDTTGLAAGDIVTVGRLNDKPYYRRIKRVEPQVLVFHKPLGMLDLAHATVARPVILPLTRRNGERTAAGGRWVQAYLVAGDWSRLQSQWLADIRVVGGTEYLPVYECIRAAYTPTTAGTAAAANPNAGYTTITLTWDKLTDGAIASSGGEPQINPANPQALLAPAVAEGPWRPDMFLQKSDDTHLLEPIVTALPKKTSSGDIAVVQRGRQMAWARLREVAIDSQASIGRLHSTTGFVDRAGGPFFIGTSFLRGHFSLQARPTHWTRNRTPLTGVRIPLESPPAGLRNGMAVIAGNGNAAVATRIAAVSAGTVPPYVDLRDPLPSHTTHGNLVLYGNAVVAGHGESKPARVLGSGDATLGLQQFSLAVGDVSFVADANMPSGVRADLSLTVAGERWTQVANLNDSGPTDAHYQVRQREDGTLLVGFGDGSHARRLPTGANNVRVVYRQGSGSAGNLEPGKLVKLAKPHVLVASAVQPLAATGGGPRESVDALRSNAAATLLALERAVSLDDFSHLARSQAAIAQARAFALLPGRGQREKIEVRVIPSGGAVFTPALADQVESFLAAHALPGVQIAVKSYDRISVGLKVTIRVRLDAFDGDTVAANVRAALVAAFGIDQRQLGQPLFDGEVFAVVEAVTGVENSDCDIVISAADAARVQRVARDSAGGITAIRVLPAQCAHLDPQSPQIDLVVQAFQL